MRLGTQGLIICRHRCLLQGLGKYCSVAVELVLVPHDTENWLYSCRKERASLGRDLAGDEVSRLTSWQLTKIHSGCHVRGQYSDCRLRLLPSKQGINLSNLCYSVLMPREGRMTQVPCVTLGSWSAIQYVSRAPCSYLLVENSWGGHTSTSSRLHADPQVKRMSYSNIFPLVR